VAERVDYHLDTMPGVTVATNRRARYDYFIDDKLAAGIVLEGPEVKSVRARHVSLGEAYATVENGEVWLHSMRISPYQPATLQNPDPTRSRKLLLRKTEIHRLERRVREKGYTLIPLRMYFSPSGYAKIELGLCRGKTKYDKREAIAEREYERRKQQALSERDRG